MQLALRPEVTSVTSKPFETSVMYQPLSPFGEGGVGPRSEITGAVLSILTGPKVDAAALFPALSAHVPLNAAVVPLVSVVKSCFWFPDAAVRPLPPVSAHANVTRTSLFVQVSAV